MPPKKLSIFNSGSISSSNSKNRINKVGDLITKSEAALSSQASVYTQRTQASQEGNNNLRDHDDIEFNREQMVQVCISKEEQEIIQNILQLARKGKVNSKNAFEIPIRVIHSQSTTSINNKFWKFASELLGASMSIYDKRVENMYISTGAFQSKLSRIGFDIRDKKVDKENQERLDDVHADEERNRSRNKEERENFLNVSLQDFSGALNLDDENVVGFSTLERKEKIDIKNIQNKFIADPTFQRTQKMFDSFSLKSLMLNIFQLSTDLDVRIFFKSDLQWQKMKGTQLSQNLYEQKKDHICNSMSKKQIENQDIDIDQGLQSESRSEIIQKSEIKQQTQTITNKMANFQFGNSSLPYNFQKHLAVTSGLLNDNGLFGYIGKFTCQQSQLKTDFLKRNPNYVPPKSEQSQIDIDRGDQIDQKQSNDFSYRQAIQMQTKAFIQMFKQIENGYDQDEGVQQQQNHQNGSGLYQAHETQSQQYQCKNTSDSFLSIHLNSPHQNLETNSMPISYQESFFAWDQKNNVMEPIMPWEIQFKNLKLTKKRKIGQRAQVNTSKKSKSSIMSIVDFSVQILDSKDVFRQRDTKSRFLSQKFMNRFEQKNIIPKQFDNAHIEYHKKLNPHIKLSQAIVSKAQQKIRQSDEDIQNNQNRQNFVFDIDINVNPDYFKKQKMVQGGFEEEETRMQQSDAYGQHDQEFVFSGETGQITKNTSFFGNQMGVNNIRQIKKLIENDINEKGRTDLEYINKLLPNLSPQQLFTIFLHLTNQHQYEIYNQSEDQSNIILAINSRQRENHQQRRHHEQEIQI